MIQVVDEEIQGGNALPQPRFEPVPFLGGNDAWNQVERERLLHTAVVRIHVERDARLDQRPVRGALTRLKLCDGQGLKVARKMPRRWARRSIGLKHFVKEIANVVFGEVHGVVRDSAPGLAHRMPDTG